jgi:hypothetical protein
MSRTEQRSAAADSVGMIKVDGSRLWRRAKVQLRHSLSNHSHDPVGDNATVATVFPQSPLGEEALTISQHRTAF